MIEYDKMSFHAEDVEVIRRYANSRGMTFVDAMHSIANVITKAMEEKRKVESSDLTIPPAFPREESKAVVGGRAQQPNLISPEFLGFKSLGKKYVHR